MLRTGLLMWDYFRNYRQCCTTAAAIRCRDWIELGFLHQVHRKHRRDYVLVMALLWVVLQHFAHQTGFLVTSLLLSCSSLISKIPAFCLWPLALTCSGFPLNLGFNAVLYLNVAAGELNCLYTRSEESSHLNDGKKTSSRLKPNYVKLPSSTEVDHHLLENLCGKKKQWMEVVKV